MPVVINTNVDALRIQGSLNNATSKLSKASQRMSTGLKVNSAKDDASGNVIAARMKVQMQGNKIAQNNVQNGTAMLATAEGHLQIVEDNLSRIRDLTLQAKNGTYSDEEIKAMQDEVEQRILEIDRISESSRYSSLSLFEDAKGLQTNGATFQVGANHQDYNTISASEKLFQSVKFSMLTTVQGKFDLTVMKNEADSTPVTAASYSSHEEAIYTLDEALDNISDRRSIIGSAQNRLESALDTLSIQYENLSSAKSVIVDADIAEEASNYTQQSILQQVSTSLLVQANQAPSIALSLI